jgi:hypothetical protein
MICRSSLKALAEDMAIVLPSVDGETAGQYGDGIGSGDEERQVELVLRELRDFDEAYEEVERDVVPKCIRLHFRPPQPVA